MLNNIILRPPARVILRIIRQAKLVYSSFPSIQGFTKKITTSSLYYRIIKSQVERQLKKDKKGPFNLIIETSNFCNARCVMCPHRLMKRPRKIMDQKTFNKVFMRIKEERLPINKIFFSGLGEPLTDPRLVSRVKAFKELGFPIKLYTNASLLTPEIARPLVSLGLDEINISFNGVTPRQYWRVMRLDFAETVKNIKALIKIKRKKGRVLPVIQISSIITRENENDIKKHVQKWSGKVDSVTVSQPHKWGGAVEVKTRHQFQKTQRTYPCRSLWHTINIDSGGNFIICCRDYESKYILGNVHTHSFADIQKSPILKRFRRLHLEYSRMKLPKICQKCNFPYQDGVEWFLPRSID